jgi:hypothetical protein
MGGHCGFSPWAPTYLATPLHVDNISTHSPCSLYSCCLSYWGDKCHYHHHHHHRRRRRRRHYYLLSPLISCFPGMLLRYFRNDFQMVPVAPVVTGSHFGFYIPHVLYFCCQIIIIIIIMLSLHINK